MSLQGRVLMLLLALAPVAYAQEQGEGKPAVSVRFRPATAIEPTASITIDGVSPLDGPGDVTLRIVKPSGNAQALTVKPAANGDYSVNFTGTDEIGSYAVEAVSPGGKMRGKGRFEVALQEPLDDLEDAHEEAEKLAGVIEDVVTDLDTQLEKLPDSPARDEVKTKWAETRPKMQAAAKDLRDTRSLTAPFTDAVKSDPKLKPALKPLARELANWQTKSVAERARILGELARSRRDSVTCEAIERIVEGFNFASALFNLAGGPAAAVKAVVFDYLASKGAALASKISAKHGFSVNESSKIALAVGEAKLKGIFQLEKVSLRAATKQAVQSNIAGLASDLASFIAARAFAKYCERLAGQFSGGMLADFIAKDGRTWWSYTIEFEGRLDLRYAKGMTNGKAVVVKGDFLGQATRFTLWEDALRIGWPGLTSGAILYKRAVLPQPQIMNLLTGQPTNPNGTLKEEKPIEVEGKAAAVFVKPYSFFVPVEGEIVDGVLTLRRQAATVDYTATARVVYVVVSPLSAMLGPQFTTFELPYKSGGFFIERAFGDSGIRAAVTKTPKGFVVDETVKREKGNGVANGTYKLKLKLCNPEGSC